MFDLVTVGHFAIDFIISPKISTPMPTLGGAPTYVSLTARKLGAQVSVISKVGEDFSDENLALLKANTVDLSALKKIEGASTTKFVLRYENSKRKLQLTSQAPSIFPRDIPSSLRARVIHVSPIANEISRGVIERLRKQTNTLSLDPQGFVRRFDRRGIMRLGRWHDLSVLKQIDLYKSSSNEIRAITRLANLHSAMKKIHEYGARIVIVTRSMKGSTLFFEDTFYDIPPCKPNIVKDPTGAGDAYTGAFLAEFTKEKESVWCACVGSAASSFVVERVGPTLIGEKEDIYKRALDISGKVTIQKR